MITIDLLLPLSFISFVILYKFLFRRHTHLTLIGLATVVTFLGVFSYVRMMPWMHYPLYGALALIVFLYFTQDIKPLTSIRIRGPLWATVVFFSLISLLLVAMFPFRTLPTPTGDHAIGTFSWVISTTREELYGPPGSSRSFRVQAWYPSDNTDGLDVSNWLSDGTVTSRALAQDFGFPGFIFDHLKHTPAHAYEDASILEGAFPVVIISHGWSGFRHIHTDLAEALASHGFIVLSIEHTYGSIATVIDENDVRYLNPQALPPRATTPDFLTYANTLVNTYAEDIQSLLDVLNQASSDAQLERLRQAMDLDQVVLVGHSTGGGAAVKVGITDTRVHGVIGLDAWVEPLTESSLQNGLALPSLLIRSEGWETALNNTALFALLEHSPTLPVAYQMEGTTHYDFGMVYMFTSIAPQIGLQGSRGLTMPLTQNAIVLDFMDAFQNTSFELSLEHYDGLTPLQPMRD